MPDDPDFIPVVGDIVYLDDEVDAVVPAGKYLVTDTNRDGSFHVENGNTAIWPRRVTMRVEQHFADSLIGRVVGWSKDYLLDASQVEPDECCRAVITVWGRVIGAGRNAEGDTYVLCETLHGPVTELSIPRTAIHTSMPEGY